MDIIKIQVNIMKKFYKNDDSFIFGVYDDYVCFSDNNVRLFVVPCNKFILDLDTLRVRRKDVDNIWRMLDHSGCENVTPTNNFIKHGVDELKMFEFNSIDHMYVNVKLLKEFEPTKHVYVYKSHKGGKSPLFILENDICVGLVLPFFY